MKKKKKSTFPSTPGIIYSWHKQTKFIHLCGVVVVNASSVPEAILT